jgi:hypothetical protein
MSFTKSNGGFEESVKLDVAIKSNLEGLCCGNRNELGKD